MKRLNNLLADLKTALFFLFFIVIIIGIAELLAGCSSNQLASSTPPPPKYQLLLSGSIDGNPYQGIGIGSSDPSHAIVITSQVAVNYFSVQSCHRSVQFTDVIDPGWFNNNTSYAWNYSEAPTIEDTGDCLLRFCAFSKTVGSPPVACAIVDFMAPKYTLPGTNICNGVVGGTHGTALCHTQVGLLERFQFAGPVVVAPQVTNPNPPGGTYWIKDQCQGKFLDAAQTLWEYTVPENECLTIFMEKAAPHRRAKLTVIPYDIPQYPGG